MLVACTCLFRASSQVTHRCCLACRRNLVRWALLFEAAGTDRPYRTPINPRYPNRQLPTEALVAALETGHTKTICHGVADTPRYSRLASTTSTARSLLQRKHCRPLLGRPSLLGTPPPRVLGTPPPRVLSLGKAPPLKQRLEPNNSTQ